MNTSLDKTKAMVRIAILGAISFLLTFVKAPLPIFPSFLKLDPSDIPAIIAALAYGPIGGVGVQLIKAITDALTSESAGVGQIANFIAGSAFVIPLGFVYQRAKNLRGYCLGAGLGSLSMIVVASVFNYFVLIPAYAVIFGGMDAIIGLAAKLNSSITGLGSLVLLAIAPFNLLKAVLISVFGYALYKPLTTIFRQA